MSMTLQLAREEAYRSGNGNALVALVPYAAYLGVQVWLAINRAATTDIDATFHLPFRPDLVGNAEPPAFHGGVIAGFMENAALLHLLLMSPQGVPQQRIPKSIDFSIDYLHGTRPEMLIARCTVERIGRRVAQVQIRCTQRTRGAREGDVDRSIAVARAHFILSDPE